MRRFLILARVASAPIPSIRSWPETREAAAALSLLMRTRATTSEHRDEYRRFSGSLLDDLERADKCYGHFPDERWDRELDREYMKLAPRRPLLDDAGKRSYPPAPLSAYRCDGGKPDTKYSDWPPPRPQSWPAPPPRPWPRPLPPPSWTRPWFTRSDDLRWPRRDALNWTHFASVVVLG